MEIDDIVPNSIRDSLVSLSQARILRSLNTNLKGNWLWSKGALVAVSTDTKGSQYLTNTFLPEDCFIAPWLSDVINYLEITHKIEPCSIYNGKSTISKILINESNGRITTLWEENTKYENYTYQFLIDKALEYITIDQQFKRIL